MNRNTNAHFSELPSVDIQRSVLDRSHSHKLSGNVGDIIPIFVDPDIMPGDSVSVDTSKVIRFQTMLTPMMDNIQADIYWFFVPHRLVWDHWINFMGENTESAWTPDVTYSVPIITVPDTATTGSLSKSGTILDYMGFPVGMNHTSAGMSDVDINALPIRAYAKICNDWFISEAITDPINIYTGDSTKIAVGTGSYITEVPLGGAPLRAAKYHDYFTSCLPAPQKGDTVEIHVDGANALPVSTANTHGIDNTNFKWTLNGVNIKDTTNFVESAALTNASAFHTLRQKSDGTVLVTSAGDFDTALAAAPSGTSKFLPANLWAANPTGFTFSVNDMRYAFQLQKLLERDARGGTRYIEVIRSHFGVTSPDARLQRSEYLGGNRFGIVVDQVANSAQSENDFLGDLGAFSVTTDVHSDFTRSFTEHGTLMALMVLRYDHTYSQGLDRFWMRRNRFDYYWPVFANIGEQPVYKYQIYCDGTQTETDVFGYNEAWAEYRYCPNRVSGEMRPYIQNGLASWTLADDYSSTPSLSDSWLRESKSNVDRVLAVTSAAANQFWADIYFNMKYTRPMPVYSIPGLIDHH